MESVDGQLGSDDTLLERERELGALAELAAQAAAGSGRLVVVEAHAGLGKTRLLRAARDIATAEDLQVLTARATELERSFPYSVVRQLFEPGLRTMAAPKRAALLDSTSGAARSVLGMTTDGAPLGGGDTFTVLQGLYGVTAALAEQQPTMLSIDDVHWSDEASLDYLGFLLPRLEDLPVLVIVASRPGEPGAAPRLGPLLADELARRLEPRALSQAATTTLLATQLGAAPEDAFAAACQEVSGGNPFLLRELARSVAAQSVAPTAEQHEAVRVLTPERVMRNVVLRLGRLSPDARAVSRALVVLGDDSDAGLVAALAGLEPGASQRGADELRAAAILDPGSALRFVHPLVRNGLYAELSAGDRELAHARAAALLRARGADAERISSHLMSSMPSGDRTTVETLMEAGIRAAVNGAPAAATTYLLRALREPPPPELRAAVLGPLIASGTSVADQSTYEAIEGDVLEEIRRQPTLRADWALLLSGWMGVNGHFDQASELVREAVDDVTRLGEVDRAFRLESWLCMLRQEAPLEIRARLTPYFAQLPPDSGANRLAAELQAMWSMYDASAAEAVVFARRALEGGGLYADFLEMSVPGWSVVALIAANEFDEARRAAAEVTELARESGATALLAGAALTEAQIALQTGDLAGAEAASRRGLEIVRFAGTSAFVPLIGFVLVVALLERGDLAGAEAELRTPDMSHSLMPLGLWFGLPLYARSHLQLRRGQTREAVEGLLDFRRSQQQWGVDGSPVMPVVADAARAHVAHGDRVRACELAEEALAHAQRWDSPSVMSQALRAKALAVGGEEGIALLQDAAARMENSAARLERAHVLHELGAALRRSNRRLEAREPLRDALELARICGADVLARDASHELLACGERRRRRHTAIGVASLTSSERRVADLAASGMTNRQIAQTLYLTIKTVETHLTATYDKLGIRSRRELAATLGTAT